MPGPYNTHVIVNVFRSIVQLVSQNPELLNTPGVFRVAGAKEETQKLLDKLISEQFDVVILSHYVMEQNKVDSERFHNILGMIPAVFKDSQILDSADSHRVIFTKKLKFLLKDQKEENFIKAAQLFDEFIRDLLLSKKIAHQRVGEILDHYCYLMHQAGMLQDANLMTYTNLAIIMAPRLTEVLGLFLETDFLGLSGFISQLTPVLENYITDEKWNCDFKERHTDKLEHLARTRHSIRDQLEHMKEASRDAVTVPMNSLMLQTAALNAQIEAIEKQRHNHSLKRKAKKELSKQLKQLKAEMNELNLRISELMPQISMMNRGCQKIQEEINLITLSGDGIRTVRGHHGEKPNDSNLARFSIFESGSTNTSTFLFPITEEEELSGNEETDYEDKQAAYSGVLK
ncbi:TPA: RhoGAP domain-containing protein [Legionella anisa]|uniref:RhoGAP domain-containing protein n=1 Tax=Legionella anisa TaxID=28082 RepID=UPI00197E0580|nr:RhoGAP domain-containing protein [Legionella anisa]MBN5937047.1 GTPase [Legionella anisa]